MNGEYLYIAQWYVYVPFAFCAQCGCVWLLGIKHEDLQFGVMYYQIGRNKFFLERDVRHCTRKSLETRTDGIYFRADF